MKHCKQCQSSFEVTDSDRVFYEKMQVPEPLICPACRDQKRLAYRNEANFYKRPCDLCKKSCISIYSKDKPVTVYCLNCWWSDENDPLRFGRNYDFSRSFFEQFHDLAKEVPKPAIMNMKSENCDYTNYSSENRNCYMVTGALRSEDCFHSDRVFYCRDVFDSYDLKKSELCYECIQCTNLYNCQYCESCDGCSDCFLCSSCLGCKDCFGCINLKNKQYHIFNKPYSKEDYEKKVAELRANPKEAERQFMELKKSSPHKPLHILNCEDCTGDQLVNCKKCQDCYTLKDSEECSYVFTATGNRYCLDSDYCDNSELQYNSAFLEQNYDVIGGCLVWYCSNVRYGMNCFNSKNLFGCVGMKQVEYCILNKQYSKEEYEKLVPRIIEHMMKTAASAGSLTGEWGDYFPIGHSPFAYNETVAHDYFPLSKEQVLAKGWAWKDSSDDVPKVEKVISAEKLPSDIADIPNDILNWAIRCEATEKLFMLLPQELEFYRKAQLPIPHYHPKERRRRRYAKRNPRILFDRECAKCGMALQSSYAPDRIEMIYCEACYTKEVY